MLINWSAYCPWPGDDRLTDFFSECSDLGVTEIFPLNLGVTEIFPLILGVTEKFINRSRLVQNYGLLGGANYEILMGGIMGWVIQVVVAC